MKMAGCNGKKGPSDIIDHTKDCVEKCMCLHMNKRDTIKFLATHKKIQPAITRTVWERLERENPEFFRAYYVRLAITDQIMKFNMLLSEQLERMSQRVLAVETNGFNSNEFHTTQQVSTSYDVHASTHFRQESMPQFYEFYNNGAPMLPPIPVTLDQSVCVPQNMFLSGNPNLGFAQTANNEQFVPAEAGYGGISAFNIRGHNSFIESGPPMGDSSMLNLRSNNHPPFDDYVTTFDMLESYPETFTPEGPLISSGNIEPSESGSFESLRMGPVFGN